MWHAIRRAFPFEKSAQADASERLWITESLEEAPATAPVPEAAEARELQPDHVLGGCFRIVTFLARGGMGEVYVARDLRGGGRVALKTIRAKGTGGAELMERFRREVESAKRVTNEHVCRIHDIHYHDPGRHPEYGTVEPSQPVVFLTMELLPGETLSNRIRRRGKLLPNEALAVIRDIALGLQAVHRAGIIHRDLKSSNIMLGPATKSGVAKITDFGLARRLHTGESTDSSFTQIGRLLGTPEYMAPEIRFALRPATVESDIYSLGVIIYQMLTGQLPVPEAATLPPELPRPLGRTIVRCLEKDPGKRFHSVSEVMRALDGKPRHTGLWALAAAGLCALVMLAVVLRPRAPKPGAARSGGRVAVAVFGFKNLTGDVRRANLSNAFATGLAAELRAGEDLRVIPGEDVAHVKLDLKLPEVESYSLDTLQRIRANTGADLILLGSYVTGTSANGTENVRLYVVTQNTNSGEAVASIQEQGVENDLPTLISRSVDDLRARLHLRGRSPEQETLALSALPKNSEALRIYSQAVQTMHTYDLPAARKLFEQAIALEPSYAPAHAELAEAFSNLGHDREARQEAELGLRLSGSLPREQRLLLKGEYYDVHAQWDKAIDSYRTLFNFFPDNISYGLLLAGVQTGEESLKTVARLRQLPPPLRDDPRIDIREAAAYSVLSDYAKEKIWAARAAAKAGQLGALGQVAEAESQQAQAEMALGNPEPARTLYLDSKRISESIHDDITATNAMRGLAVIEFDEGDLVGAERQFTDTLAISQHIGS